MNRYSSSQFQAPPFTPVVKWLVIINLAIWIGLQILLEGYGGVNVSKYLALYPGKVLFDYAFWQLFTYMFLHSMSVSHILFNLLTLWFVGSELEQRWGKKFFLNFYLLTGVGAGFIYTLGMAVYSYATGKQVGLVIPVMGASGAIFGLLLAYGLLFGERVMSFMFLFPMKAKYFVMILGGIEILSMMTSGVMGGEVAYLAHLGGLISGYLILRFWTTLQRLQWNRKAKTKTRNLRLVVDNEKKDEKNPKYWN
jgi:membrane associated rhomboid family serine protease